MDSTELERAALQQKDREQLVTIATAMGQKPPSRARKAEIVDLILELAGVGDDGGGSGAADSTPATDDTAADAGDDALEAGDADADADDADDDDADDTAADAASDDDEQEEAGDDDSGDGDSGDGDAVAGRSSRTRNRSGRDRNRNGSSRERNETGGRDGRDSGGGRESSGRESGGRDSGARESGGRDNGGRDSGGRDNGGRERGTGDSQEGDTGNRRRRRRGRDRTRGGEDTFTGDPTPVEGVVDLRDEGYAFLRVNGHVPSRDDVYIPVKQVRNLGLRKGDHLTGSSRPAGRNEKNPALHAVETINGAEPDSLAGRPMFDELTPLFPDEQLTLEGSQDSDNPTARIVDLVAPIGKGQRGMIVSPPKAGKTTILKQIAQAIERNHPEVELFVLLVDERPEEVTDMRRSLDGATVAASTFDRPAEEHTQVADLTIEMAKRRVEAGSDVVILLDGLTRLARAYNMASPGTGRTMAGGMDSGAIQPPKKFFGAARNVEEGGSLTILATALVDSGSAMDAVIFEEFAGTANMELHLDRQLADKRIFPAIDINGSSTRHDDQLLDADQLDKSWKLRRGLSDAAGEGESALEVLLARLGTSTTNADVLNKA